MVGIAIAFDLGRYHATPWGSNVNDAAVEWPPSSWRLLRALYSVSRTNTRLHPQRNSIDRALCAVAQAPPPRFTLPPSTAAHTRHYLPSRIYSPTKRGETDRVIDAFRALDHTAEMQVWWEVALEDQVHAAFRAAVEALSYLGRSESVCSARILDSAEAPTLFDAIPAEHMDTDAPATQGSEILDLLCIDDAEDPIAALTASVGELRAVRMLQPPGTRFIPYIVRERNIDPYNDDTPHERPTLARFRVVGAARPSMQDAVAVGSALRDALQGRYGRRNNHASSPAFSGRNGDRPRTDQHAHAHYLATPGNNDARRVEYLTVWAPEGFDAKEIEALATLKRIRHWSFEETLQLVLTALGSAEMLGIPDLLGESSRWRSLTPFGLTRHPKRRGGRVLETPIDQIRREWALRHPEQAEALLEVKLLPPGRWLAYRRTRPGVSRLEAPRVVGAELRFAEPVQGPIALGALSHYGLGLFTTRADHVPQRSLRAVTGK
jgi:CRISPR-associated protein Csb2